MPTMALRVISPKTSRLWPFWQERTGLELNDDMTTSTDRIEEIFRDARELQVDALEMLAQGRIRNAAEKAWGATRRATDALVLARTGEEPEWTPETGAALRMLSSLDGEVRRARLVRRYHSRQVVLHGECFYNGLCDPLEETERRIRETSGYIDDAERLAEQETP